MRGLTLDDLIAGGVDENAARTLLRRMAELQKNCLATADLQDIVGRS